ncbi:hypothetical protein E4U55_003678 [Claviceps digitariae]|nr:hypothetical protein E4U55_003678 [Claviceps digitariae]
MPEGPHIDTSQLRRKGHRKKAHPGGGGGCLRVIAPDAPADMDQGAWMDGVGVMEAGMLGHIRA